MVNYQGPELVRGLAELTKIPIFDRVRKIEYVTRDVSRIQLSIDDVATMYRLEHLSVSKRNRQPADETEIKTMVEKVPPCRLATVKASANQINVDVYPGFSLACRQVSDTAKGK